MNWLDIVIIVMLAISVFSGLKTGLIKSILSLAGVIVGVVLAGRFYVTLAEQLTLIPQDSVAKVAAFAIIVVAAMIVAAVIGAVLTKVVSAITLGWVNRLGGAVFGLSMGAVFVGAALALWVKFIGNTGVVSDSSLAKMLLQYFPAVLALLPGDFGSIRSFFR
ncbi:MAG: CvpA family protein [Chloroflexota bacterium]|nr:CvpA family protein [Chloroflexota bacterium]